MRCTIPTTTGTWWRRASCSSEKMDHQARKATRVQARASQPSRRTSGAYLRTARFRFHGYMTIMQAHPSRTLPRKGSCDGGKGKYDRAMGHVVGNQPLDDSRDKSRLLHLHKQFKVSRRKKRQCRIEGKRILDMTRRVV